MRPVKLIMKAFGAYLNKTEIDFDRFDESALFLITGDTGAGKTTIFDAISFALYGEASGPNRKPKSFRSDYAADTEKTQVEFWFTHKGKMYYIKRNPEYVRKSKNGEGTAIEKAGASLEADGTLCAEGISAVSEKIRAIIGLTHDQFTQTVMIAQGDFMKILTADSVERKKLFQKIFRTERYALLQDKLKLLWGEANKEREDLNRDIAAEGRKIDPEADFPGREKLLISKEDPAAAAQTVALLEKLLSFETSAKEAAVREYERSDKRVLALGKQITQADNDNGEFARLKTLAAKQAQLEAQKDEIAARADRLAKARRAQNVSVNEKLSDKAEADRLKAEQALQNAAQLRDSCKAVLPALEQAAEKAKTALPSAEAASAEAQKLNGCIPSLRQRDKLNAATEKAKKALEDALRESSRADRVYQETRSLYYASRYALIAQELEDGKPCPVCGSTEHPVPAPLTEASVTREQFELSEKQRAEAEQALYAAEGELKKLKGKLDEIFRQLDEMAVPADADEKALSAKAEALGRKAADLKAAAEKAAGELQKKREEAAGCDAACKTAQTHAKDTAFQAEQAQKDFLEKIVSEGFAGKNEYFIARDSIPSIGLWEESIRRYNEDVKSVSDSITDLKQKLAGKSITDTAALQKEQAEESEKKKNAYARMTALASHLSSNESARKAIENRMRIREAKSEEWERIEELYFNISGQPGKTGNRTAKLSFEAYVQQYYFKQVIIEANLRLNRLTDGMFRLRVKPEAGDRRSQSGLDLEVLDSGTGVWRDVSTLSGGESFLTSLSLALGLSDAVQKQSGEIRLETMFIDEGFGSLDENMLINAVNLLSQLAGGSRLVGVISHMSELASRIDSQIVVKKTRSGSEIEILS